MPVVTGSRPISAMFIHFTSYNDRGVSGGQLTGLGAGWRQSGLGRCPSFATICSTKTIVGFRPLLQCLGERACDPVAQKFCDRGRNTLATLSRLSDNCAHARLLSGLVEEVSRSVGSLALAQAGGFYHALPYKSGTPGHRTSCWRNNRLICTSRLEHPECVARFSRRVRPNGR